MVKEKFWVPYCLLHKFGVKLHIQVTVAIETWIGEYSQIAYPTVIVVHEIKTGVFVQRDSVMRNFTIKKLSARE